MALYFQRQWLRMIQDYVEYMKDVDWQRRHDHFNMLVRYNPRAAAQVVVYFGPDELLGGQNKPAKGNKLVAFVSATMRTDGYWKQVRADYLKYKAHVSRR